MRGALGTQNHSVKESHYASAHVAFSRNALAAVGVADPPFREAVSDRDQPWKATRRWVCSPSPSTDRRIVSPGRRKRGGLNPIATPEGVPVGDRKSTRPNPT